MQTKIEISRADKVTVWVIVDNYYDALRAEGDVARRYRAAPGKSIHAEHGLAYYVETVVNGKTASFMFDFGLDPVGVINNMKLLDLDVGKARAFALSHGHLDHWTGAAQILKHNRDRIAKGTPFFVGEETFLHRYSLRPATGEITDLGQLSRKDIEAAGVKITEVRGPTQIIPGAYLTGNIDRVTVYEKTPSTLLVKRDNRLEPDDFWGEQAIFFNVGIKGLVILSGCAHAGIVNTVTHAQKLSGVRKIYAVMGGFHLTNAAPEIIDKTVADIRALEPDFIAPAHCTGFEALVAFSNHLPKEFNLNTAGTRYEFTA